MVANGHSCLSVEFAVLTVVTPFPGVWVLHRVCGWCVLLQGCVYECRDPVWVLGYGVECV